METYRGRRNCSVLVGNTTTADGVLTSVNADCSSIDFFFLTVVLKHHSWMAIPYDAIARHDGELECTEAKRIVSSVIITRFDFPIVKGLPKRTLDQGEYNADR